MGHTRSETSRVTELDIEQPQALVKYLRKTGRLREDETPRVRVLAGGVSNRTVLVELGSGTGWVFKQALSKLRVKVDWFSDPARIHREALGIQCLDSLVSPVMPGAITPLVLEDRARYLLAMQAVPSPHDNWKTLLLAGDLRQDHVRQFGRLLGVIHRRAYEQRHELSAKFADTSFFESLRIEPYYAYSAAQVAPAERFIRRLIDDTHHRQITLVHGDYSPKNILIHADRMVLLDHEVIHWGDPAFDVGFGMTHLLSKAHFLPDRRADFADAALLFWQTYREELGEKPWAEDLETMALRHTLGCLLARVAGRSTLEYFNEHQQAVQQAAVVALMRRPPKSIDRLVVRFLQEL